MTPALRVVAPGLMTTLQDLGRRSYQHLGIPVSGALDPVSLRAANLIAGNDEGVGALEIAYQGPTLAVEADSVRIAFAGCAAPIDLFADENDTKGERLPLLQSARLERGQLIRVGALTGGAVLYLAVEGGFDVAPALGSQSTLMRGGLGGFHGRPIKAGDILPLRNGEASERDEHMLPSLDLSPPERFRVVLGPQDDYFSDRALKTLAETRYTVSPASDRMGMRLAGPQLEHAKRPDIVSDGIAAGSIQVPGNGLPIILLADRQTTGGYPKIATVISADLPALGRLTPGAKVAFEVIGIEAAEAIHRQVASHVQSLREQIAPVRLGPVIDEAKLMQANLVSGMVDARD